MIETPITNSKKSEVGMLRLFTTGRDVDAPAFIEPEPEEVQQTQNVKIRELTQRSQESNYLSKFFDDNH